MGALADRVRELRDTRQLQFVLGAYEALKRLDARVDHDFLRTDEFAEAFEETVELVGEARQRQKRDYYIAALANTALPSRPSPDARARMFAALEEVRTSHLDLLALVATTTDGARPDLYMGGVADTITHQWPEADIDQVRMDWADLARLNILQSYPSGTMSRQGATNLSVRMTPFGRQFHEFIKAPS